MEDIPSHRACASCRSQKVRCIPVEDNPDVCQRCRRSGRTCIFTPLQKRKQRKRTDTRVAELEREMRAMRAMLKQREVPCSTSEPEENSPPSQPLHPPPQPWDPNRRKSSPVVARQPSTTQLASIPQSSVATTHTSPPWSAPAARPQMLWPATTLPEKPVPYTDDIIDRGLISWATAQQLLETYKKDLFWKHPLIYVPDSVTAEELRHTKPVLFLAILAAASVKDHSDISAQLDAEVLQTYATRSVVLSQKSLELVQALMVSSVWYYPLPRYGQFKYYEYCQMAISIAMDIGIGSRPVTRRGRASNRDAGPAADMPSAHPNQEDRNMSCDPSPSPDDLEARRTFLGCYISAAGITLSLRRPSMLRVNSYIRECLAVLENCADPIDANLTAWVRLVIIADEITMSFCYDDPGGIASLADIRTQMMLKDFDSQLASWRRDLSADALGPGTLMIMYYTVRLYLYEIALHVDHSPEDFKSPFQMGGIDVSPDAADVPTHVLTAAVCECISSAHALLDHFLNLDVAIIPVMPVYSYVRVSFAGFYLAKLSLSACHPESRIGRVLDKRSLKIETYMDRTILRVRDIISMTRSRTPSIFLALLFKLRQWCLHPTVLLDDPGSGNPEANSSRGGMSPADEARIIEHINSSADSPEAPILEDIYRLPTGRASSSSASTSSTPAGSGATPCQQSPPYQQGTPQSSVKPIVATPVGVYQNTQPQGRFVTPYCPPASVPEDIASRPEHMNIDNNHIFSFLEDLTFPEGGLTGFDGWAMPPNNPGAGNQFNFNEWQFPSGGANHM